MAGLKNDAGEEARALYADILRRWNERDAAGFAALFVRQGNIVGFDGSQVDGQAEIEAHLSQVFGHHETAAYVGKSTPAAFHGRPEAAETFTAELRRELKADPLRR
jgi:uncharacterized protein (TIGR02246 family)